jgi:hypothetical protein
VADWDEETPGQVEQEAVDFLRDRTSPSDSLRKVSDLYLYGHVAGLLEACIEEQAYRDWLTTVTLVARAPSRQLQLHCLKGCIYEARTAAEASQHDTAALLVNLQVWQAVLEMHAVCTRLSFTSMHTAKTK